MDLENFNTIRQYFKQAHWSQAINACRQLLKQNPDHTEARYFLGAALIQDNNLSAGIKELEALLKNNPNNVNAWNALAIGYERAYQYQQALDCYHRALELRPDLITLSINIADLQRKLGYISLAIAQLTGIITLHPDNVNALNILGLAYVDANDLSNAKICWEKALKQDPSNAQVMNNFSALLYQQKKYADALLFAEQAFNVSKHNPGILNNYANCLNATNQFEAAIPLLREAINLAPQFLPALQNLGHAYHNTGNFDQALDCYQQALTLAPNDKYTLWQRAFTHLLLGNFRQGWQDYEIGLEIKTRLDKSGTRKNWSPAITSDASVIVNIEQGIGDQIMFCSCLPDLIQHSRQVSLECEPRLAPLFKRSFPAINVIGLTDPKTVIPQQELPEYNYEISMGSLPHFFRNSLQDFPRQPAFLITDHHATDKWRQRYTALGKGLKVGISWRGGVLVEHQKRSLDLEHWLPILQLPHCHFINLQYGNVAAELHNMKENHDIQIHEWPDSNSLINLDDFAAKIAALDLVIAVGNTNVHLAGALGTPTWCLTPFVPSWRWLFHGDRSVWYPSVKIVRQPALHEWRPVIEMVTHELKSLSHQSI